MLKTDSGSGNTYVDGDYDGKTQDWDGIQMVRARAVFRVLTLLNQFRTLLPMFGSTTAF